VTTAYHPWGRVDADGTVYVRTADGERVIGSWQAGSPEEAIVFFQRKYEALETEVVLLEQRIATATVAIVLRAADPNRTAFTAVQRMRSELLLIAMRRTDIPLARGSRFATDSSLLAEHRLRPFHLASSYALADRSRAGRTTTGRNDNTRRV